MPRFKEIKYEFFYMERPVMKKRSLRPDARALNILKICMFIIMAGLMLSLAMYIDTPTYEMAKICKQSLYSCAFACDVAVGGFLYMDHGFKKQKKHN